MVSFDDIVSTVETLTRADIGLEKAKIEEKEGNYSTQFVFGHESRSVASGRDVMDMYSGRFEIHDYTNKDWEKIHEAKDKILTRSTVNQLRNLELFRTYFSSFIHGNNIGFEIYPEEFLEYIKSASSYQPQQLTESMKKGAVVSTMGISGSKNKQIDEKEYLMGMKRLNKLNYQKANDIIDEHWGNVTKGLNMMKVANKLSYEMTEARNAKQTFIVYRN